MTAEQNDWRAELENSADRLADLANDQHRSFLNARAEARATDPSDHLNVTLAYERAFMHATFAHSIFCHAEDLIKKIQFAKGAESVTEDAGVTTIRSLPMVGRFTFGSIVTAYPDGDPDRHGAPLVVEIADPDEEEQTELTRTLLAHPPTGRVYAYSYETDEDGRPLRTSWLVCTEDMGTATPEQHADFSSARFDWLKAREK